MYLYIKALILVSAILMASAAAGQTPLTLDCDLRPQHLIVNDDGKAAAERDTSSPLVITFTEFNFDKGSAKLVGNVGSDDVSFRMVENTIFIVQVTPTGNMTLTSMNIPKQGNSIYAVHSRHIYVARRGILSQWAGNCKVR